MSRPTFVGTMPSAAADEEPGAPKDTTLPIGFGLTTGPSTLLIGGTLDFPVDKMITFGPSLQYGIDDNVTLISASAQLKYFLPTIGEEKTFLPFVTGGVGMTMIDKEGRSSDSGAAINIGGGVRYLTGKHYLIGSEGRFYFLPDELGGERSFFSFEVLQIIVSF